MGTKQEVTIMKIRKPQIHFKKPDLIKVVDIIERAIERALRGVKVPPP